jgi:hypothetical protein
MRVNMRSAVWTLAWFQMLFVCGITSSASAQPSTPPPKPTPAQQALERAAKDQQQIRDLALKLKDALLELNRLSAVPPSDPAYKSVPDLILKQSGVVLQLAAAIYSIAQGDGLAAAVVDQRQSLQALLRGGLPPKEREVLAQAGFSDVDIAELSTRIQLYGTDMLDRLNLADQKKRLDEVARTGKWSLKNVLKIGGGALLISVDVGSVFIPLLTPFTAFEVISSVGGGILAIGDGLPDKPK